MAVKSTRKSLVGYTSYHPASRVATKDKNEASRFNTPTPIKIGKVSKLEILMCFEGHY